MNSWIQFKGTASMKNKNPMRFCLFGLLMVLLFFAVPCQRITRRLSSFPGILFAAFPRKWHRKRSSSANTESTLQFPVSATVKMRRLEA